VCSLIKIDLGEGERKMMDLSGSKSEICVIYFKEFGDESEWS